MFLVLGSVLSMVLLIAAMLLTLELGRRLGMRRVQQDATATDKGSAAVEGAVFGLMGLLIAFAFSGGISRLDIRRDLKLKEANALGTAWLRLDLLSPDDRSALQADFRRYLDLRLADARASVFRPDPAVQEAQQKIWVRAIAAARAAPDNRVATVLLPAINEMFDVASAHYVAVQNHPPLLIYLLLLVLALVCSLLAGHGMAGNRKRNWTHTLCFVGSLLLALYVIIDLEFPRHGLIRIDSFDRVLVELRHSWQP
jgi:hypothetical protein